ncbi:alpha/beta fold hydrolase [Allocatelliglobosispora scoriae]|uniref:alpha/beta fold hydrolase n=1 Tax=Allocatelliglobosispora scoriae TaxID=643052 RepID=UPI001C86D6A2|nr:alpha/beta hydrolase [Allocatelliglobosispora scoriae]
MRHFSAPLAVLAGCLALAACSGSTPAASPSPSGPVAGAGCEEQAAPGRRVHFGKEIGADLYGIVLGTGNTGIVLAHMNGGDSCQWIANATELSDRGYRALVFDFAGFGVSPTASAGLAEQVRVAAAFLVQDGATKIVLMGASMGATASVAAAPSVAGLAAVVSISAPETFSGVDGLPSAKKMTVPVLYAAGENESADFVRAAQSFYAATPATTVKQLVIVPSDSEHGVYLVLPGMGDEALRTAITRFLTDNAPA